MPTSESIPTTGDESRRMSFDTISPLEESLREVIEFISSKEGTMRHSKSINFKRNVGTLLERVHTMVVQNSSDVSISRYSDNHSLDEGLALTKNLLTSAPTATLNTYKPVEVSQGMIPTRVVWKRRWKKICLGSTTLTIIEKTTGRFSDQDCDDDDDDTPSTDWHFGTKVTFRPKNSTRMLQIEVQQYQFSFMGLTMPPRFIVNNIRPDDSLVFKIAEYGSVDDLLHLFSTGQASLRDCDERGASLLYYGLRNPPVCKLLVEEGLDVDEWIVTKQGYYRTLLHIAMLGPSEGRCSLDTGRILLSAGADPNERGPRWRSVIDVLTGKEHKTERDFSGIQQVFDHAPHFVLSDSFEGSVIHNLCGENRGIISRGLGAVEPDRLIELALKRGCPPGLQADIGSPLHACFRADLPPPSEANWLKALVRLVQNGTDIFAVDMWGVPVSDIAYAWPVCYEYDDCDLSLGSYREDLFDALLGVCHYNIADFRNNRPRIARYTGSYRRQDFEKLWEGHEALCPYWDDDVWPALPEQAAVENSDDGKVLCVCNYRNPTQWIGVDDPPTGCCFVNPESDDSDFWSSASGFDSGEDMSEGDINEDDI
ncbi:hypothetical protein GGR57DRAFT_460408 [Xylariaceae sp. FL1272]|nr:hypothetical protein GGR57DRAFT_460408 [Xylariaceae sp. FL1272]